MDCKLKVWFREGLPKHVKVLTLLCLLYIFVSPVRAADGVLQEQVQIPTQKHILDNGLTVLISEMPTTSTVSVYALIKTGSANEGKFLGTGISHLLEHMLFKGTEKRGVGDVSREVQALGGVINASTSFDFTIYTISLPSDGFDQALDIVSDMLMNSSFDAEELEKERKVVYDEIRMHNDRPGRFLSQMIFRTVYTKHPYRLPIIGYEELLRQLKREDFLEYYQTHYVPNNIVLSVAGNIKEEEVLSKIKEAFKDFQRQRYVPRNLPEEPQQISMRRYEERYPTELTRMSIAYSGVSVFHEDMPALDVLAMILGQGESSRLYLELFKKQKIVRSIYASDYTPMDRGVFEVECVLDEENIEKVIAAVKEQIKLISRDGVETAELEKTKRQALSGHINGQQTSGGVAYHTAADEFLVGDYNFSQKYVDALTNVTADDVKRVAQEYFHDNKLSIVVLKPKKDAGAEAVEAVAVKAGDVNKVIFGNGLTVLLRENHSIPLVSISLALNGGTRWEVVELNGISELTSRLWIKGTESLTADQIAEKVESRGARLSGFSGKNSFGIQMSMLAGDLDFSLNLLEDLVKNASFDEQELQKEKEKVKTAIIAREDSISSKTVRALKETLFLTHPFRLDGLGDLESVERIQRQDIVDIYNKLAYPNNMVLSVFGDFESEQLLEDLRQKFAGLTPQKVTEVKHQEPAPDSTREKTIYLDKQQAMVMMGFQGVGLLDKDRYGLNVLSSILGSSFSGRIFTRVRDELGESYSLGGGFSPAMDAGMIYFYVLTKDESVEKVKQVLIDLVNEIRDEYVTDIELNDMKAYLKGTFQMGIETNSALGFMSGLDELYGLGYNYYLSHDDLIDQVTKEDVRRLAREYLDINKAAIVISRPEQIQGAGDSGQGAED